MKEYVVTKSQWKVPTSFMSDPLCNRDPDSRVSILRKEPNDEICKRYGTKASLALLI